MIKVNAIFSGGVKFLEPEGEKTGIFKNLATSVEIDKNGIIGDTQVDKRFHGGPERALHQYSIDAYQKIIESFPELKDIAIPGSIGENISSVAMDDSNVHIGDIYHIGNVIAQVSQPRSPCWKINRKFDNDQLAKFIAQNWIPGWLYRVVQPGTIHSGDTIKLVERQKESVSIRNFMRITLAHRPDTLELKQLINNPGLNPGWQKRLQQRMDYIDNL